MIISLEMKILGECMNPSSFNLNMAPALIAIATPNPSRFKTTIEIFSASIKKCPKINYP